MRTFLRGLNASQRMERFFPWMASCIILALIFGLSRYEYEVLKQTSLRNTRAVVLALFPEPDQSQRPLEDVQRCTQLRTFLNEAIRKRPDVQNLFVAVALPGEGEWTRLVASQMDCSALQLTPSDRPLSLPLRTLLSGRVEGVSALMRDDQGLWVISLVVPLNENAHRDPSAFLVVQQKASVWLYRYANGLFPWVLVTALVAGLFVRVGQKQREVVHLQTLRQTLLEANLVLNQVHEIGHLGSWKYTPKDDLLEWSEVCYRIAGQDSALHPVRSREDLLSCVHPEDQRRVEEVVEETLRTHGSASIQHRFVAAETGDVRSVLQRFRWVQNEQGKPDTVLGIMLDLTETHARMSALKAQESLVRDVVNTTRDGYWVVNSQGRLEDVNESYCRMTGYSRDEMLTLSIRDLEAVETPEETRQRMDEIFRNGFARFQTIHRRKDASLFDVEVSVTFSEVSGGKMVCFCSDITQRKEAQKKLQELNGQLEQTLLESRALAQQALAANRAKTAFMATMSHEIRTPLNGVIAMTDLLQRTDLDADQRDMVETIQHSGTLLMALASRILDLARIDSEVITQERKRVSLHTLAHTCLSAVDGSARAKGLNLTLKMAPDLPVWAETDGNRVQQVVLHLLDNAVKFTEQGTVSLALSCACVDEKGILRIDVKDTGIGIAPDVGDRIFDRFWQGDSTTTRRYGGAGLGLALAREVVTWMGGEMGYVSEVGVGSTFWFTLPCVTSGRV